MAIFRKHSSFVISVFLIGLIIFVLSQTAFARDMQDYMWSPFFKLKGLYLEFQKVKYPQMIPLLESRDGGKAKQIGLINIEDPYKISNIEAKEFLDEFPELGQGFQDLKISIEANRPIFKKENFYRPSSFLEGIKSFFGISSLPEYGLMKKVNHTQSTQGFLDLSAISINSYYKKSDNLFIGGDPPLKQEVTFRNNADYDLGLSVIFKNKIKADHFYWKGKPYFLSKNPQEFGPDSPIVFSGGKAGGVDQYLVYDFSDIPNELHPVLWGKKEGSQNFLILSLTISLSPHSSRTIDPTLQIINVHSHPKAGDYWTVNFTTRGRADLKITPVDLPTINDLNFISLKCGNTTKNAQVLSGDVIYYPNWSCNQTSSVTHLVNVEGHHTLKFQFGSQTAYAYNSPGWLTGWNYRKARIINSASGAGTDYQVLEKIGIFSSLPANAATHQTIPTYDGSGEVVDPDIVYFPSGWHGYKYWMSMTPYPGGDSSYENPSIVASNDGVSWTVPTGLTNPIEPKPSISSTAYNSDAEIFYDSVLDELWVYYRQLNVPSSGTVTIYRETSADGVTWGDKTAVLSTTGDMVSPAVAKVGTTYYMWGLNGQSADGYNLIERFSSTDGTTWASPTFCTMHGYHPVGKEPWHLNVEYIDDWQEYWMLLVVTDKGASGANTELEFLRSRDGINWYTQENKFLARGPTGNWDETLVYASAMLYTANTLKIWYSARNSGWYWYVGYTSAPIDTETAPILKKSRMDLGDIRFTDNDETTILTTFHQESYVQGKFWVKIPEDLSSTNQTIYVYYGNDTATTISDGPSTFPWFFDDLDNYSIGDDPDTSKYSVTGTTTTDTISVQGDPIGGTWTKDFAIKETNDAVYTELYALFGSKRSSWAFDFSVRMDVGYDDYFASFEDTTIIGITHRNRDATPTDCFAYYNGSAYTQFSPNLPAATDTWYQIEEQVVATGSTTSMHWLANGADLIEKRGTGGFWHAAVTGINKYRWTPYKGYAENLYIGGVGRNNRYIFLRKFVDPEPSNGSWGAEETANSPPNFNTDPDDPHEDPASSGTSPTNEGTDVIIKAKASDAEGNSWRLLVCKNSFTPSASATDPECNSGSSNRWCRDDTWRTSGTESTCHITTTGLTNESYDWYAFACDNDSSFPKCSSAFSGTPSTAPDSSPFKVNHRPDFQDIDVNKY